MADTWGLSGSEAAGVVTAAGGVLAVIGKGIVWVFRQRKGRITQLETDVKELRDLYVTNVRQVDCLIGVAVILIGDIGQHRPDAPVIGLCKSLIGSEFPDLLKRAFPLHASPADMLATILKAK